MHSRKIFMGHLPNILSNLISNPRIAMGDHIEWEELSEGAT